MDRARFERLVEEAVASLPAEIRAKMDNVVLIVEDYPASCRTRRPHGDRPLLLGLYEGQPLTERDSSYGMVFPDRITIYQRNVEAVCRSDAEIREEVRLTVWHEIAHHFGIDDQRLHDLGY
jgi:predicted Zn-dependent protease with MMP-like domain